MLDPSLPGQYGGRPYLEPYSPPEDTLDVDKICTMKWSQRSHSQVTTTSQSLSKDLSIGKYNHPEFGDVIIAIPSNDKNKFQSFAAIVALYPGLFTD